MKKSEIYKFMEILQDEYKNWEAPVVTLMANRGASAFEILVSTILSLRTKDEVTIEASKRIDAVADTPQKMIKLSEEEISKLIYPVGFYKRKATQLKEISKILLTKYSGKVPNTIEELLELPGVGRKTANLVMVEGHKLEGLCVDTHVHRISNRIGYVKTKNPEQTEFALRENLPKQYWVNYNEILVAFGQILCRPISPHCTICKVESICQKVGVDKFR